jgi:D-beta-D-heptose 7-phosphate kinase/D-beta-D-heptose 1-phosphate adenosyltransferase
MNLSNNTQPQKSFNVLLIGDSCIDEYKIGTIDRLSPEAPVPVIKIVETETVSGMASNVKKNFENLGIEVDFITNNQEIIKTRYIDKRSGQHMLRVDTEPEIVSWSGNTSLPIDQYDVVVISDYNKGFLTYEHIETIIRSVKCPVFIDTKKQDLSRFGAPHVYVKINELEYKNRYSIPQNLIVTLGGDGALLKRIGHIDTTYSTKSVEVMDVCGCGDTFLSALTAQYLFTNDIEKSIIFANIAAGLTVQHRGNYAPSYDEIRHAGY